MKIIISPYSRKLRNGKNNAKNYPYWQDLINLLRQSEFEVIQIGNNDETKFENCNDYQFNLNLTDLKKLSLECDSFFSVDNFYPHFCNLFHKRGVVIFSLSDPLIFGYKDNLNILKSKQYLRKNQFDIWESVQYNEFAFFPASIIFKSSEDFLNKLKRL